MMNFFPMSSFFGKICRKLYPATFMPRGTCGAETSKIRRPGPNLLHLKRKGRVLPFGSAHPSDQNRQVARLGAGTGFARPVHVNHAGDGSGRVFVVEQAGTIRTLDNAA